MTGKKKHIAGNGSSTQVDQEGQVVSRIPSRPLTKSVKSSKLTTKKLASMKSLMKKTAAACGSGGTGGGGVGGGGMGGFSGGGGSGYSGNTIGASSGNFYSPELSTDFLELPQALNEQWNYYRFFYNNNPYVGQAIDLHTELPLSKIRLAKSKVKDPKNNQMAQEALEFCDEWAERIGLLQRLMEIVHEFHLIGEVFIWAEDGNPDMPKEVTHKVIHKVLDNGELVEDWEPREDADDRLVAWVSRNYKGWTNIRTLPPEQVQLQSFTFTNQVMMNLIPDAGIKHVIDMAQQGDPQAQRIVATIDPVIVRAVTNEDIIPLNTDPDAGSFIYYMANKRSSYDPRGHSILQRCLQTLVYADKLRQAQTQIASRHMTPIRLVYAENMDAGDTDALRDQIDLALQDPDYSIVTNFQVVWEEMNSNGRLLELSSEYDLINRHLYAGLGVTESLLNGESSYSGDRINLEVINTRYMLLREQIQRLVETQFFKPMCRRMGFVELDKYGNEHVLYPRVTFTRIALRDNSDTFDQLFNLYQKGSLDIETIFDTLGIDSSMVAERLKRDTFTVNDTNFNSLLQSMYGRIADLLVENTDIAQHLAKQLGLAYNPPKQEDRF